jgi:RHS repeat-associated protein
VVPLATTHYVGRWYEYDPVGQAATVYCPFNGQAVAMLQGSTLTYLHRDQLGSLVSATDPIGTEVGWKRYWPFGASRLGSAGMPSDRLFTGQTRDDAEDQFYFFQSRYYDAQIGKFHTPDRVVPDPTNPQALNRYAYALNNPLRLNDPSGHDPLDPSQMDPAWAARFAHAHQGDQPTLQDWEDDQFSVSHAGSGPNGAWTAFDWQSYHYVRAALGPDLMGEIGRPQDIGPVGGAMADTVGGVNVKGVPWVDGPDGSRIYLGGGVPPGAAAWTFGNNIIIGKDTIARLNAGQISVGWYRSLIIHEYVHVLQYRRLGAAGFLTEYVASGVGDVIGSGHRASFGNGNNVLEAPAYAVQYAYWHDPGLVAPWSFWQ